ncbi:nuclear factor NF-kappa-B p110 subunit isoform X2 [Leptopilina boulardi]|nr:nuclear factor NF-kappa-B p110 subunit isoform X2 [Leptopilina boulardi]XP_051156893.1 nuclear factor NF-kappa-B p110 subunit isoform X2 [Leptopilina boulardi]
MNIIGNFSPSEMDSLSVNGLDMSPMSIDSSPIHAANYIMFEGAAVLEPPYIRIMVQPVDKFRFRYKSEMMGTHGSLSGERDETSQKKEVPTVQLLNYPGNAVIRCSLVTSEEDNRMPHAHHLVKREGNQELDTFHEIEVSEENEHIAVFNGMGIIHTAKKNIKDELVRKKKIEALEKWKQKNVNLRIKELSVTELTKINQDADEAVKTMNLNSVSLCFQAFYRDNNDVLQILSDPVYSHPINNLKSALTGELKISRIDKHTGNCEGSDEIFILVEKVGKKNIKIKFYELDESDNEIWCDYGKFSELDVHHQYAIVFRTPAYKDTYIESSKTVFIKLERPSDGECSNSVAFTYKASEKIQNKKRPRVSYSTSTEFQISQPVNNVNSNSQISTELIFNLIQQNASLPSEDLRSAINDINIDFIDNYTNLVDDYDGYNVTDGSTPNRNDETFAKDMLAEIIDVMKNKNLSDVKSKVMSLLKEVTTYGDTPLHAALRYNQTDITKTLIMIFCLHQDFKSLVNAENSVGKTPLHYAVIQSQPEVVKALLMLGADPNISDEEHNIPLHVAVCMPDGALCVDVLLAAKSNVESANEAGWIPLHLASKAGSLCAIKSLIRAGVDVNKTDLSYGRTALHIAVEGGHKDIVEFLLNETKIVVNKKNFGGNTALHSAVVMAGSRAKEICSLLIQHGADPSVSNRVTNAKDTEDAEIKTEIESDEEECRTGQTSFDLAKNNLDILELLQETSRLKETPENVEIKDEKEMEEPSTSNDVHDEDIAHIASILDRTQGWKKLAEKMGLGILVPVLKKSESSPSLTIFSYTNLSVGQKLLDTLKDLKEEEAVTELEKMFNKKVKIT